VLRHVSDEDKKSTKEGKDQTSVSSSSTTTTTTSFSTIPVPTSTSTDPELFIKKKTWFIKNYTTDVTLKSEDLALKHNVYVLNCKNCTITVPAKFKAVQLDGCHKVSLVFKSVVSLAEIFNSSRIKLLPQEACPGVAIDKSSDVEIILNRGSETPVITHTNSTDMRLIVPGKTENSDPIEHFIPHQFTSKLESGTLITTPVVQ